MSTVCFAFLLNNVYEIMSVVNYILLYILPFSALLLFSYKLQCSLAILQCRSLSVLW
jgi:hypothetical protein